MTELKIPKKLIEVALPLDAINEACAYEKMPGIGPHPRGIHLYWARRPLAAARAIIFAQMVNDPGYQRDIGHGVNKIKAELKREKLFQIIRDLVNYKNINNEEVLDRVREEIWSSWRETCHLNRNHPRAKEWFNPEKLPAFHDPFAGGGAIPLEAQRLGLESYASDLNPIAVMINKAMIEIPTRFTGSSPIGPIPKDQKSQKLSVDLSGVEGLAEDVRRYGYWIYENTKKKIGHLYPKVPISSKMARERDDLNSYVGNELTVIAWVWVRTVKSPNPAYGHIDVPLTRSFVLSGKKGKEAWIEPIFDGENCSFEVRLGTPPAEAKNGTKLSHGSNFRCIVSGSLIDSKYIKTEGKAGRIGKRMMAVVAKGSRSRIYLSPTDEIESVANQASTHVMWRSELELPNDAQPLTYGFTTHGQLFTDRQLVSLTTFSDMIQEARSKIIDDAIESGWTDDQKGLYEGGSGATAYGDAIAIYLAFCIDRCTDFNNSLTIWLARNEKIMHLFSRQAIPMAWDFGEANILERVVGGFITNLDYQVECLLKLHGTGVGYSLQQDAVTQDISTNKVISTDPPYYDNIGYADLSDFFYIWMRRSLRNIYPNLFATIAVPKSEELVANSSRHGGKEKAEKFFLEGMVQAMNNIASKCHPAFPVSIYYAFKQSETKQGNTTSTGWATFLESVIRAGFLIDGTWPVRSEQSSRFSGIGSNVLASSIVLVCRKHSKTAETISRRDFLRQLRDDMPEALQTMMGGGGDILPFPRPRSHLSIWHSLRSARAWPSSPNTMAY